MPAAKSKQITNPFYERITRGGIRFAMRLPPSVWARAEAQAARESISLHAALRQAILIWLCS